ncbi:hypothetical protein AMS60_02115 [Bacillus sp. FJAT-21945]|nr:hypothetical protein AMS60_02115 [Bacillus sp. FJAT-21945]
MTSSGISLLSKSFIKVQHAFPHEDELIVIVYLQLISVFEKRIDSTSPLQSPLFFVMIVTKLSSRLAYSFNKNETNDVMDDRNAVDGSRIWRRNGGGMEDGGFK